MKFACPTANHYQEICQKTLLHLCSEEKKIFFNNLIDCKINEKISKQTVKYFIMQIKQKKNFKIYLKFIASRV